MTSTSNGGKDEVHEDYYELEVDLNKRSAANVATEKPTPKLEVILNYLKQTCSMALVIFSVVVVMTGIFKKESSAKEYNIHPVGAFCLFWALILWLANMEGGQGCLVGLQQIDKSEYKDSHPKTLKSTTLAHKGDNMDRFIVGRQFLVVLVIFLINMCGSAVKEADPLGLPGVLNSIFLDNGVALMVTTAVLGQLTPQLNGSLCMLDFINNYFMLFTTYISLFIEASGLLHAVYIVQILFSKLTGQVTESNEPPRDFIRNCFFWGRALMSTVILTFALATTLEALLNGKSGMWNGVPIPVSIVIFFLLLCIVGFMEGMQIAAFSLINLSEDELKTHKVAFANCQLMFSGTNLQAFLIGRQVFVAALMFIVAKIATIKIDKGEENIFGVSDGLQKFFDTGLLGAIVLTIIGSLIWRVIASSLPLAFMSNPAINVIIRLCLIIEKSGICSAAWVFAHIHKTLCKYQEDDNYLRDAKSVRTDTDYDIEFDGDGDDKPGFVLSMIAAVPQTSMRMSIIPAMSLKATDPASSATLSRSLRMSLAQSSSIKGSSAAGAGSLRNSTIDLRGLNSLSIKRASL
jgi:hypothetical protein